jgi:predicted MFS family arabinose efflux permease
LPNTEVAQASLPRLVATCFLPFAAGYFLSYFYRSVNAVVGPVLVAELGLDAGSLGLLTSAYFMAFATFQLPLGILLDRFGPRRVEAVLLLCAAAGAVLFGLADNVAQLTFGRALIGLGVSSCLMASFKANTLFWPPERLAVANGFILAFGGLGATVATLPVEWLLKVTEWRVLFFGLAGLTVLSSFTIWTAVPERDGGASERLGAQVRALGAILGSARFWRVAPITVTAQAAFLAYQGLWTGPWLRDVAGLSADLAATVMFFVAVAIIVGYGVGGMIADRLMRAGIRHRAILTWSVAIYLVVQVPLALNITTGSSILWIAFSLLGTNSILGFSFLTRQYPAELAGRVNSGMNLLVFLTAFAIQAGVGVVISWFTPPGAPFSPAGYQAAFIVCFGLQIAGWLWFVVNRRAEDP